MSADSLIGRVRGWMETLGPEVPSPADVAVLQSILASTGDPSELGPVLAEYFDVKAVAVAAGALLADAHTEWPRNVRESVAQALLFHGLDDLAGPVLASLARDA